MGKEFGTAEDQDPSKEQAEGPESRREIALEVDARLRAGEAEVARVIQLIDGIGLDKSGITDSEIIPLRQEAHAAFQDLKKELQPPDESPTIEIGEAEISEEEMAEIEKIENPSAKTAEAFFQSASIDFNQLEALLQNGDAAVMRVFDGVVGQRLRERLRSAAYRTELREMDRALSGTLGEGGLALCKDRSLKNVISIRETLGTDPLAFVHAMDLSHMTNQLQYKKDETSKQSVLRVAKAEIDKTMGELQIKVELQMPFDDGMGYETVVQRDFFQTPQQNEKGELERVRRLQLARLDLSPQIRAGGLAARMTQETLVQCDKAGIDEMGLHAVEVGGYAWASYGYGWDDQKMVELKHANRERMKAARGFEEKAFRAEQLVQNPSASAADIAEATVREKNRRIQQAEDRARQESRGLPVEQRMQLLEESLREQVESVKMNVDQVFMQLELLDDEGRATTPELQSIQKQLEEALQHPLAVTPQFLAGLGKDGPFFRRGASDQWYTEEGYQKALVDGTEQGEADNYQGPLHVGKVAMLFQEWHGRIDLKSSSPQQGKNRALLEKKIQRSVTA